LGENPGPTGRGTSLHPQQQTHNQAQRRLKARTDDERRQTYNLTEEEVKKLNGVRTGRVPNIWNRNPEVKTRNHYPHFIMSLS